MYTTNPQHPPKLPLAAKVT